jgi:glutamate racemase
MKKDRFQIGVLDSGLGGLSVLEELMSEIPAADIIYYGDLLNSPYGTKSSDAVRHLVSEIVEYFLKLGVNSILMACNTATSVSAAFLREKHKIPIFGMEPAIKPALEENPKDQIAVLATSLTLREDKFESLGKLLGGQDRIVPYNCDGLAKLIDQGDMYAIGKFLDPILQDIQEKNIHNLVLGCTHYVLVKPIFYSFNSSFKIYDGNSGTVRHMKNTLSLPDEDRETKLELILNGGTEEDFEISYRYLNSANKENRYVR